MRSIIFALIWLASATQGFASAPNNVNLRFGGVSFTQDGYRERTGSATGLGVEWENYPKTNNSIVVGYKMANDPDSPRLLFQAAYIGTKFYPLTLGRPEQVIRDVSVINVTSPFMPFLSAAVSLGRASMQTFGRLGGLEASSEYYGIAAGFGAKFNLVSLLNAEVELTYERTQGYGELAYSGTNIGALLGVGYFF